MALLSPSGVLELRVEKRCFHGDGLQIYVHTLCMLIDTTTIGYITIPQCNVHA